MTNEDQSITGFIRRAAVVFGYSRRALDLVWTTSPALTLTLGFLTLIAGILPAVTAYVGQLIVNGVVNSIAPEQKRAPL
jgi:ATP-binding cassette subfamily B protein